MKKRNAFPPRVFNDPEGSLRRATSTTHSEREQVAAHMKKTVGGTMLPPIKVNGEYFSGREYRP